MFHDSLQNEPHLGISFWEKECPVTKRIAFTIPGASWEDWQFDMRQLGAAIQTTIAATGTNERLFPKWRVLVRPTKSMQSDHPVNA